MVLSFAEIPNPEEVHVGSDTYFQQKGYFNYNGFKAINV